MKHKQYALFLIIFCLCAPLHADEYYCYQKPEKCPVGSILIIGNTEDVAMYCDFNKQIVQVDRNTRSSSSLNAYRVLCVKIATPRKDSKKDK